MGREYSNYSEEELIEFYKKDHENEKYCVMWGQAITQRRQQAGSFILRIRPESILDYGSGKGYQYSEHKIHETWKDEEYSAPMPTCYDPGVKEFSKKPGVKFDAVVCFDVMEHIKESDCEKYLHEIFNYARKGVCLNIATNPAKKSFPAGTNYHVNCKPEEGWFSVVKRLKPKDLTVWLYFWSFRGVIILNADW